MIHPRTRTLRAGFKLDKKMDPTWLAEGKQSTALPVSDFSVVFESAPIPFLMVLPNDPVFTFIAANDAYVRLSGIRREDLLGRGVFEVFPDNPADPASDGVQALLASYRRVLATRASDRMPLFRCDLERPAVDGGGFEERYWSARNTPVVGADGLVEYIFQSVEEITEQVRVEEKARVAMRQLETSEKRFRQLAETSGFGLVIADLEGSISHANSTLLTLLGYAEQDVAAGLLRWTSSPHPT